MSGGTSKGGVKVAPYVEWGTEINIKKYKNGYITVREVLRRSTKKKVD